MAPLVSPKPKRPLNIILMVGDGMGVSQVTAALYSQKGRALNLERFKVIGFHKSYADSNLITDSAAGATAFSTGKKTYNNAVGMDRDTLPATTIVEMAEARGLATGIIVTCEVTHATPAAFYAHQESRVMYEEIALDLSNSGLDLVIGGGWKYFGERDDHRMLLSEMRSKGFKVRDMSTPLHEVRLEPGDRLAWFTDRDRPPRADKGRTYLADATDYGMEFLRNRSPQGFFLLVEGSQIDWGGHANDGEYIVAETLDFDAAVGRALDFAEKDQNTLVIVTGDHETGGLAVMGGSEWGDLNFGFATGGHSADLIPVYAYGPGSELFHGFMENTDIFFKMVNAFGWDAEKKKKKQR